mmetsp:Transcript_5727/g.12016  ORF Transcript_5727/g.12016 Transcript_5727/m.12016 type:complete len:97 (+) Transcript_5727:641-931(+)
MELSLAVTASLAELLSRCGIFCTEPWRIPLAGQDDEMALDKTGILTSDEIMVREIVLPHALEGGGEGHSGHDAPPPFVNASSDNVSDATQRVLMGY